MRVLLICNSLGKGYAATAQLAAELVESLAAGGNEVEVLSSVSSLDSDCGGSIKLHKCPSLFGTNRLQRHLREVLLLSYFCLWACHCRTCFDVVVVMDSPRFCGLAAMLLRYRTGAKCIAWVMDLPFEQSWRQKRGIRKGVAGALSWLSMWIWRRMDNVVTLGRCMAHVLSSHGVSVVRIRIIGIWGEDKWTQLHLTPVEARARMGVDQRLTIMYSGYAAQWHDFRSLCEALRPLATNDSIQLIFAGSGPGLDVVRKVMGNEIGRNVFIRDRVVRGDLDTFLACADIHLASLDLKMLGTCTPSKVYPPMALGRPIAFLGPDDSQASLDLNRSQAGLTAETPAAFVEQLKLLVGDEGLRTEMGLSARAAYLKEHSRSVGAVAWQDLLKRVVESTE